MQRFIAWQSAFGPRTRPYKDLRAYLTACLLYTSDAADERSSVDLGGRRIIKKKTQNKTARARSV